MVDLLVKLLGPTLYNLGVNEADLISTLHSWKAIFMQLLPQLLYW
ncbi:MAG: hypothetical protein ACLT4D_03520 [Blautia faecis]